MEQLTKLGSDQASVVLYLINKPVWPQQASLNIPALIEKNGNHWRKICTIFSKLVTDADWREYRDQQLLTQRESIFFTEQLSLRADIHIFCGKESWKRFEQTVTELTKIEEYTSVGLGKITYKKSPTGALFIFTPYFDSRQFSNALIAELKDQLLRGHLKL